jgi:hypothetical protein
VSTGLFAVQVDSDMGDGAGVSSVDTANSLFPMKSARGRQRAVGMPQICLPRRSSGCSGQNHWRPIFLTALLAEGVDHLAAWTMRSDEAQSRRIAWGSRRWGPLRRRSGVVGHAPNGVFPRTEAAGWPGVAEQSAATRTNVRAAQRW